MGCEESIQEPKSSVFGRVDLGHVRELYLAATRAPSLEDYLKSVFKVEGTVLVSERLGGYIAAQMKNKLDFRGFVRALEYIVHGRCVDSITVTDPMTRFFELIQLSGPTKFEIALELLLKLAKASGHSMLEEFKQWESIEQFGLFLRHTFPVLETALARFVKERVESTGTSANNSKPLQILY